MLKWYIKCLKNYVVFQGRARRKEFWSFLIVTILIAYALIQSGALLRPLSEFVEWTIFYSIYFFSIVVYFLYSFIPTQAVAVRRLHDVNKSGWPLFIFYISVAIYVLLFLEASGHWYWGPLTREDVELILLVIPSVPFIWLLILFCKDSYPTENEYGPNPKTLDS